MVILCDMWRERSPLGGNCLLFISESHCCVLFAVPCRALIFPNAACSPLLSRGCLHLADVNVHRLLKVESWKMRNLKCDPNFVSGVCSGGAVAWNRERQRGGKKQMERYTAQHRRPVVYSDRQSQWRSIAMEMVEEKRAAEEPDVADIAATDPTSSASMSAAASISSSVSDTVTTTTTPAVPVRRVRKRRVPPTKVARACVHCKNAHITCEEKRPCTRCVKKGLQDSCVDAPRKARKYLLGVDNEALAFANTNTNTSTKTTTTSSVTADLPLPHINELDTLVSTRRTMQPQHQPQPLNSTSINCTRQNSSSLPLLMPEGIPSNEPSQSSNDINFLSSAADSEYAILGNIIDQTLFPGDSPMNSLNGNEYGTRMAISNTLPTFNTSASFPNTYPLSLSQSVGHGNGNGNGNSSSHQSHHHNHGLAPFHGKHVSPALSTTSDELEYLNYQPLMTAPSQSWTVSPSLNNSSNPASPSATVAVSNSGGLHLRNNTGSPFVKPLQPLDMLKTRNLPASSSNVGDDEPISTTGTRTMRKMKYSDLYPREPYCDASTNQYFIGTMSTIDGIKTHTFPEVVKQISKFKRDHPDKFKERNRRSAISFCVSILDDVNSSGDHESSPSNTATAAAAAAAAAAVTLANTNSNDDSNHGPMHQSPGENCNWKCGLLYHEPSEIYEKVKQPFAYVRPYHDLNLYLKSRFPKEDLVHISKSIAEYRPSFIAGMIKLKEDDLIFAEQCFQRTLLEYDSYIGISGTPTLVWRRTSQIAYVGDEFCILTGWTREELLNKSTFAVEIMDDKSCVDYFKIFSKIAFGDMNGDILTECTLLTPKGESIRTSSVWTMKRDVFGIPMMIIATFLPILT